jgi:hypothetical protein
MKSSPDPPGGARCFTQALDAAQPASGWPPPSGGDAELNTPAFALQKSTSEVQRRAPRSRFPSRKCPRLKADIVAYDRTSRSCSDDVANVERMTGAGVCGSTDQDSFSGHRDAPALHHHDQKNRAISVMHEGWAKAPSRKSMCNASLPGLSQNPGLSPQTIGQAVRKGPSSGHGFRTAAAAP